uniref:Uncharacterized protein n=1 Tax=Coccidioides posadasii RMSCC 3488 TaxID=454284 RepID=A0A0J6FC40_COCPO|nr:hypothetical protein CPAG_06902 [Coccidioides posadasii RMSCC 3488]
MQLHSQRAMFAGAIVASYAEWLHLRALQGNRTSVFYLNSAEQMTAAVKRYEVAANTAALISVLHMTSEVKGNRSDIEPRVKSSVAVQGSVQQKKGELETCRCVPPTQGHQSICSKECSRLRHSQTTLPDDINKRANKQAVDRQAVVKVPRASRLLDAHVTTGWSSNTQSRFAAVTPCTAQ